MKRSKSKSRGNPLNGKTKPLPAVTNRQANKYHGKSLGFAKDKSRKEHNK